MENRHLQAIHPRRAGIGAALAKAISLPERQDAEARLEEHRLRAIDRNERAQ